MSSTAKSLVMPDLTLPTLRRAFIISAVIHVLGFSGWKVAQHFKLFDGDSRIMRWIQKAVTAVTPPKPKLGAPPPPDNRPVELQFVQTDPSLASFKPPDKAKYQGAVNQIAANPTQTKISDNPQIDGKQNKELRTMEAPRTAREMKPQPASPKARDSIDEKAQAKSKAATGNIGAASARVSIPTVSDDSNDDKGQAKKSKRKRTLSEVKVAQANPGERMMQEGGVGNIQFQTSLAVRGTALGSYENAFVTAVKERWYTLINDRNPSQSGRVRLEFVIHSDGRISDMKVLNNEVGDFYGLVCKQAVFDPAPYAEWPPEMKRELQSDQWKVTFTFWYMAN
jgi:outer membrane biosynthesis protein TonB